MSWWVILVCSDPLRSALLCPGGLKVGTGEAQRRRGEETEGLSSMMVEPEPVSSLLFTSHNLSNSLNLAHASSAYASHVCSATGLHSEPYDAGCTISSLQLG